MPRYGADDASSFLPPRKAVRSSSGGGTGIVVVLLIAIAIGFYVWHMNRKDMLERDEKERAAREEEVRRERKRECDLYVAGSTHPTWKYYDLSTARPASSRQTCDDDGDLACPAGFAAPPCKDSDCAPGYSGVNCDIASCEIKLAANGGHGNCVNRVAMCNENAYGTFCDKLCTGSSKRNASKTGCDCPGEYLFKNRLTCSGECKYSSVTGANCDECAEGFSSTGSDPQKPTALGCEVDDSIKTASATLTNALRKRVPIRACDLMQCSTNGCADVECIRQETGESFTDGVWAAEVPRGYRFTFFEKRGCTGIQRAKVECDSDAGCADKKTNTFTASQKRNASVKVESLTAASCM